MSKILDITAKSLSVLLYPLFIPTYGMVLFCIGHTMHVAPLSWVWMSVAVVGTFVLTCVLPVTAIWLMMKRGQVQDLYIDNPQERTMPYIYSAFGFGCWSYLLVKILHAPLAISWVAIGATLAIAIVALINHWWKISAHLAGLGGLFGGLLCYCLWLGAIPSWSTLLIWLGVSWLLMWARMYVGAHTGAQVSAGWLLGLLFTFIPFWLISNV